MLKMCGRISKVAGGLMLIFSISILHAQNNSLEGSLQDEVTSKGLEDASIALYKVADSTLYTGTLTKMNGIFGLNKIQPGVYYLVVQFIGYKTKTISNIHLVNQQKVNLGVITINPSDHSIQSVVVRGERANADYKIDKQIYKADQFQSSQGGTAVDVLKNLPSISMDVQGELRMRGSSGFLVLLNGKPVQTDIDVVLSQIPANTIENIEVITAPSAKYDPDGKAGIINITTKRGAGDGFFITTNLQGGFPSIHDYGNNHTAVRFGGDATVNYKKGLWDISAGISYLRNDAAGYREGYANTVIGDTLTEFPSNGERSFKRYSYSARASATFTPDKNNSFTAGLYAGKKFQARTADLLYNNTKTDLSSNALIEQLTYFNANLQTKEGNFYLANFDYTHTFINKSSLTVSFLYEYADLFGNTKNLNQASPKTSDTLQFSYNTNTNPLHGYRASVNHSIKIGSGQLESGYEFRYDKQNGNFIYETNIPHTAEYIIDPVFTSGVYTSNQIHSVYSQFNGKATKVEYTAGLRYEYATRILKFSHDLKENKLDLSNLFPSANVLYSFENKWKAKAAYSRRIQRTRNFELNPFPEREHSETLEQGDPSLLPEFVNLTEAGFIKEFKGGSLSTTLYHQQTKNSIQRVNSVYNDTILNRIYTNAGDARQLGVETGVSIKLLKWWQLYVGGNVYDYKIKGALFNGTVPVDNQSFVYSINANNSFQITSTFDIQLSVNYLSKRATAQGEDSYFFSPNLSFKKTFIKGRLSATLQWQNIDMGLNISNRQRITTWGKNFYTSTNYIVEGDVLLLNVSFNLKPLNKKLKLPSSEFGEKEF